MNQKQIISQYMSKLAKKARKMHPKPKEYYQQLQKLSIKAQKMKKLINRIID